MTMTIDCTDCEIIMFEVTVHNFLDTASRVSKFDAQTLYFANTFGLRGSSIP